MSNCSTCGKHEGENHDLPGRCKPEMAKITEVELAALLAERDTYRAALERVTQMIFTPWVSAAEYALREVANEV